MAHNHIQGHNHEVMNYNHKEGTHQTEQNQLPTKENTMYYNQNNSQYVNLQYARQNNQPYGNRYMVQPTNNYQYSTQQNYEHPYAVNQQTLNHYQQQQQNYAHQYLGPSGYNQQHTKAKHKNRQYTNQQCLNQQHIIQQLTNQQPINPQNMNQQCTHQPHITQLVAQTTAGGNCNLNQPAQNKNTKCKKQPIKKPELTPTITCTKKIRLTKCKPKKERSTIKIIKTKSRIYKCKPLPCKCKTVTGKCKPLPCKCKTVTCKCKPLSCKCKTVTCKCKTVACKCKPLPCKCKTVTSKCKPGTTKFKTCICKVKPCKCHKIKIKICPPCPKKVDPCDNPCTDQNEEKEQLEVCALSELDTNKEKDKFAISENSEVQSDCTSAKMELDKEPTQHTCLCELHLKDILKETNMLTKLDGKSTPEPGNKSHGILKKNTEYDHQDEESRLLLPKKHRNAHPDQQYSHNFICECHSKGMKTSQNKTIKNKNNKNKEQRLNSKHKKDPHIDQYQASIQSKNILPHYHLDKNRVLLPKNNYTHKNKDRYSHLYELHTHDFSKKQNEMLINQAKVNGKSEATCQENQLTLNYHQDDLSTIELTSQMDNQQDQESVNCLESNPNDINVRLNEITKNQEQIQGIGEDQNKLGGENTKGETGGDSTLKSSNIKSNKQQNLQQKRRDMIQDSISFCSVM